MKKINYLMCMLLGAASTLVSCIDDDKNLAQPEEKTTDLIIPDAADWTTTRSVNLSVTSPVENKIAIYTDAACTDENLLAEMPVSEDSKNIRLDVAKATKTLYIQYPTSEGKEVMDISLNAASTRGETVIKLPENIEGTKISEVSNGYIYQWYPSKKGEATLMFEDNWPETGDYDFNDFVIWYHTQANFFDWGNGTIDSYANDGLEIKITFRAMGGYLPYRLGLQLDKTHAKYIDEVVELEGNDLVKMELQNPGEDAPAIFIFTGTEELRKQTNGGKYYNTDAAHQIAQNNLVTIKYKLKMNCFNNLNKMRALWASATSENQNFFLQKEKNGGREIHLRGYEPTAYYSSLYASEAGNNMNNNIKYCSSDNFVWGIKVPVPIAHPAEEVDIIEAYGKFKSWITNPNNSTTGDGEDNTNWYNFYNASKVIN